MAGEWARVINILIESKNPVESNQLGSVILGETCRRKVSGHCKDGAEGGSRTHTGVTPREFESRASAYSATSACVGGKYKTSMVICQSYMAY